MGDFDFTGFKFNGKHSSDLGIVRVSGGDRYEESLHPEIEDRTAEVPGLDGSYFFGANYKPRTIEIEIAFDSLTEEGLRNLKRIFNPRYNGELIFEESPYKKYIAKLENPMELSYVCFDERERVEGEERDGVRRDRKEGSEKIWEQVTPWEYTANMQRIYKGEGKISFICYFPFAKSVFKYLSTEDENCLWAGGSGLLTETEYQDVDIYDSETGTINLYNPGDIETGFRLFIPATLAMEGFTIVYKEDGLTEMARMVIDPIILKTRNGIEDIGVLVDTTSELIVGVTSSLEDVASGIITTSGNLYNGYISAGHFFKIQPNLNRTDRSILEIENGYDISIFYDYLYF